MTYRLSFQPQNEPPPIPASEDAPSSLPITSAAQSREAKLLEPITHHGNIYLSSTLRHFLNHRRLPPPASIHTFIASMPLDSTSLPLISSPCRQPSIHPINQTTISPSQPPSYPQHYAYQPHLIPPNSNPKSTNASTTETCACLHAYLSSPWRPTSQHSTYTFKLPLSSGLEIQADVSASSLAVKIKVR